MQNFISLLQAAGIVLVAIIVIFAGAFIGTFIVPVFIVAILIVGVFFAIQENKSKNDF